MTKQETTTVNNFTLPWSGDDYITAPCDNDDCLLKDTSRSGCRRHSKHMVSMCEFYQPEQIWGENGH